MSKRRLLSGGLMIGLSILISFSGTLSGCFLVIKYCAMACGITLLAHTLIKSYVHHSHQALVILGYLILISYILLTVDTFLFHAITWFPGMIRYPIYSLYGWCYIVFLLPGWLMCFD